MKRSAGESQNRFPTGEHSFDESIVDSVKRTTIGEETFAQSNDVHSFDLRCFVNGGSIHCLMYLSVPEQNDTVLAYLIERHTVLKYQN